jgi:phage tail-like protein
MRGIVADLPSPHPMGRRLPAVYQEEDPFTMRLTEALDEVLAPIISTLDNLPAYLDPRLTPDDFLDWLAGWVAFDLDEGWDDSRRRSAIIRAVDLLRRRGTAAGLADEVRLMTGADVELVENGGTSWSLDPMSPMVGSPAPTLLVRVTSKDPSAIDVDRVDEIVRAAKPAHIPHQIEVLAAEPVRKAKAKSAPAANADAGPPPDVEPPSGGDTAS